MKKTILILLGISIGLSVQAQAKKSTNAPATATSKPTPETIMLSSFETSLVSGTLTLSKTFKQGENKENLTIYTLSKNGDASFNNRKPIQISLSRKSYDSVFTHTSAELANQYPALNKYIADSKILLTEENGWIALIRHYNNTN